MSELTFTVRGPVVPKGRPRFTRRKDGSGGFYARTPKRTREYEKKVTLCAAKALGLWRRERRMAWPADATFRVELVFYCQDRRKRDVDNLSKSILDGLNGALWKDDAQVAAIHVMKHLDSEHPRAEVTVRAL